jgi:hypothetical protein
VKIKDSYTMLKKMPLAQSANTNPTNERAKEKEKFMKSVLRNNVRLWPFVAFSPTDVTVCIGAIAANF